MGAVPPLELGLELGPWVVQETSIQGREADSSRSIPKRASFKHSVRRGRRAGRGLEDIDGRSARGLRI